MRVALYIRVSTDEQAKSGYSIPDQRRELYRYAESQGYEIVGDGPIIDEGYSGASRERPGLDKIMELAEAGSIDAVVATKRDRYWRKRLYRLMMDEDLEELDVKLIALNDTGNKIGDGVQDDYAEWEKEVIAERTQRGRKQRARSGKVVPGNGPPYGYQMNAARTMYEVEPVTMANVRRALHMAAEGSSLRSIKRTFESEGIPSPNGNVHWSPYYARRLIFNDAYRPHSPAELKELVDGGMLDHEIYESLEPNTSYGIIWYGTSECKDTSKGRKVKERPKEERIAVPVPHSGVDRESIDRARAAIKDNKRPKRADSIVWPLSGGIIFCACGRRLLPKRTPSHGRTYHYYACSSYWVNGKNHCPHAKSHKAEKTEKRVSDFILNLVRDPNVLREQVEAQAAKERKRLQSADNELQKWHKRLQELERRRSKNQDMYRADAMTLDELTADNARVDQEQETVREEIDNLTDQQARLRQLDELPQLVEDYLRDLPDLIDRKRTVRDHESIGAERTEDNSLGLYTVAPDSIRYKDDAELEQESQQSDNERAHKLRSLYDQLGLQVTAHKDGTLDLVWSVGSTILPSDNVSERSL